MWNMCLSASRIMTIDPMTGIEPCRHAATMPCRHSHGWGKVVVVLVVTTIIAGAAVATVVDAVLGDNRNIGMLEHSTTLFGATCR